MGCFSCFSDIVQQQQNRFVNVGWQKIQKKRLKVFSLLHSMHSHAGQVFRQGIPMEPLHLVCHA